MGFDQAPALPYRNLGIVQDGDTASQSIQKDKYVIWKGGNYFAKTDILQGETFVVDTNLTEITEGAINGIVSALNASIIKIHRINWPSSILPGEHDYTINIPNGMRIVGLGTDVISWPFLVSIEHCGYDQSDVFKLYIKSTYSSNLTPGDYNYIDLLYVDV